MSNLKKDYSNRYLETGTNTSSLSSIHPDWSKLDQFQQRAEATKGLRKKPVAPPGSGGATSSTAALPPVAGLIDVSPSHAALHLSQSTTQLKGTSNLRKHPEPQAQVAGQLPSTGKGKGKQPPAAEPTDPSRKVLVGTRYTSGEVRADACKAGVTVTKKPVPILVPTPEAPIDLVLERHGVFYRDPSWEKSVLLPLLPYDDKTLVFRFPEEWSSIGLPLKGYSLRVYPNGSGSYQPCVVTQFDAETGMFWLKWLRDLDLDDPEASETLVQDPFYVYFEGEDLSLYARRVGACHQRRRWAESLLKYSFCIESMPTERISTCPRHVLDRISDAALNTTSLQEGREELGVENLCIEVCNLYSLSQNKIIFDKVVSSDGESHLLPSDLEFPPEEIAGPEVGIGKDGRAPKPPAPFKGVCNISVPFDFRNAYTTFCRNSLRIRPEVVLALVDVQAESSVVLNKFLFRNNYAVPQSEVNYIEDVTVFHKPYSPQKFLEDEGSHISSLSYLPNKYIPNVRSHLYRYLNAVERPWFNLYEVSVSAYKSSRLRCFLEEVDLRLQDTLHTLGVKSLFYFAKLLDCYQPLSVEIKGLKDVRTIRRKVDLRSALKKTRGSKLVDFASDKEGAVNAIAAQERLSAHMRGMEKEIDPAGEIWPPCLSLNPEKPVVLFSVNVILVLEKKATQEEKNNQDKTMQRRLSRLSRQDSKESALGSRRGSKLLDQFKRASNTVITLQSLSKSASKERRKSQSNLARRSSFVLGQGGDADGGDFKPYGFDIKPASIVELLGYIYEKGITRLDDISSIQLLMLPHLFPAGTGFLNKGFKSSDSWCRRLKDKIMNQAGRHLPWLQRTLELFEQFSDTINLNPEEKLSVRGAINLNSEEKLSVS